MLLHSLAVIAFSLLSRCIAQDDVSASSSSSLSLSEVLAAHKNLSSFNTLLTEQLPNTLKAIEEGHDAEYNPITVLALSNHALDRIQYNPALSAIWANNDTTEMSRVIAYHVLLGKWTTDTLSTNFTFLPTMTIGSNFSNVTGGQRVGAVLQNGNPDTPQYEWEMIFISGAAERSVVSIQDIPFSGGIVQVIDNPLNPPAPLVPTAEDFNLANYPFAINSFLGALYSTPNTSLQKYLNETKDVTIFVPANVAFETVSDAITSMSNETRMDLLSYHVLAGSVLPNGGPLYSSDFQDGATIPMHDGQNANMMFHPNSYFLNSARIVQADIMIYNGVIHVIDVLLDPDQKDTKPNPTSATQAPVLAAQTDGSFNVSQAPFTTYLPNYVPTDLPTTTSSISRTSSTFSASQTGSSDSGARTASVTGHVWLGAVGSWILLVAGTAGAYL